MAELSANRIVSRKITTKPLMTLPAEIRLLTGGLSCIGIITESDVVLMIGTADQTGMHSRLKLRQAMSASFSPLTPSRSILLPTRAVQHFAALLHICFTDSALPGHTASTRK